MKNYYTILGINDKASIDEIKKAYRQLAIQYHPDKNKDPSATHMFKDISEAYQVLSDQNKRSEYDQTLHYQNPGNFKEFKFVYQDPMKIFTEVFSFMNDMQAMFNMMDSVIIQQMRHVPMQNIQIHQIHQLPGMAVHIIDLTQQMFNKQPNHSNISHVRTEEKSNKTQVKDKPLLLENGEQHVQHVHIIDDNKLDILISNTLKQ